jgi:hypothetical protein
MEEFRQAVVDRAVLSAVNLGISIRMENGQLGALYFVEMKWHQETVGKPHISEHLVRLMGRAEARGLIISASDFTAPAIQTAREFLQHKIVALVI